jgi:PPOX class probable F420-dependent enzyme
MTTSQPILTPEQAEFLRPRQLAILATGRRDGSPQQSMVTYLYDGTHILVSITKDRAKYANIRRLPKVCVLVPEGRRQLVVYGEAELVEGRVRDEGIRAIRAHQGNPLPEDYDLAHFSRRLDELGRVLVRIRPTKALG